MATSGSSARSTLLIQLSPTRSAKLSFTVQLILALVWLIWATYLLLKHTPGSEQNFLYYAFFGLAVVAFLYVMLQNTSVFGVQSYIEVTTQYIVQKNGVFRTKLITAIPDIEAIHISPLALRITERSGSNLYLDLKQVRKKRDKEKIKAKIKEVAQEHGIAITETTTNKIS